MNMEERKSEAYHRFLVDGDRKNTHSHKRSRLLWSCSLLVFVAIVLGGSFWFVLPFPLQPDSHTLYSTDWSRDFNTWQGAGWQKRLNGGVHSDHGGLFLSPYVADGPAIQIDVQMKHLGVDAFQYGSVSFGIVLKNGNADHAFALGDIDSLVPWPSETYNALLDFALVSVKIQKGTVTLLINGKKVAQKSIDFPIKGALGLFAGGDSIVEARSFRVDEVIS
ncbi:MAG TPA: hypothetical protein VKY19_22715 [Ktedonosporobacter sp.]|jgi:hypothetical protein|nr:hypothetical protein [Ktedonosporobacter sp.]